MTWQVAIIAHVVVSALMMIFARRLSLSNRKAFYVVGFMSYMMISITGVAYSLIFGVPWHYLPTSAEWLYILPAGIGIATAWLLQYRIIGLLGASNAIVTTMAKYIGTALLGFIFLHEGISATFILGAMLILTSIWLTLRIRPDEAHRLTVSRGKLALIIVSMVIAYSFGMMFEKIAIDSMGVWQYARYGWPMQFVSASVFMLLIGRKELLHADKAVLRGAAMLGLLTSVAGVFYILALSIGTLSGTILAASAKIALISVLSYIFLRERNALPLRLLALGLTTAGLWLI